MKNCLDLPFGFDCLADVVNAFHKKQARLEAGFSLAQSAGLFNERI